VNADIQAILARMEVQDQQAILELPAKTAILAAQAPLDQLENLARMATQGRQAKMARMATPVALALK
jgi:hypothetical protein